MSTYLEQCEEGQELINLGAPTLAGMVLELRLERDTLIKELAILKNSIIQNEYSGHNPT
jgi:hypothetical protein